jgi:hypothetical protein
MVPVMAARGSSFEGSEAAAKIPSNGSNANKPQRMPMSRVRRAKNLSVITLSSL